MDTSTVMRCIMHFTNGISEVLEKVGFFLIVKNSYDRILQAVENAWLMVVIVQKIVFCV